MTSLPCSDWEVISIPLPKPVACFMVTPLSANETVWISFRTYLPLITTTLINKTFLFGFLFLKLHCNGSNCTKEWTSGTTSAWKVQLITNSEGGKKRRNKKLLDHKVKGKKKKKNYKEGVSCCLRRRCGRAGLRPGEGSGNGPKQHTIASLIFSFFKSLTPPHHQALFFSDWGNAGPPEAANRSLNHWEQLC